MFKNCACSAHCNKSYFKMLFKSIHRVSKWCGAPVNTTNFDLYIYIFFFTQGGLIVQLDLSLKLFLYYSSLWFTTVTGCTLEVKGISVAPLWPLSSDGCVLLRERGQRGKGQIQFIIPPAGRLKTTVYASALLFT